jgi:hypothetical protein
MTSMKMTLNKPFITNKIEELNDKILGINNKNVNIKKYNEYIDVTNITMNIPLI